VCDKFSEYLCQNHLLVFTDNNPLTYVVSTAKLDAVGQRWASQLVIFFFSIQYRPGVKNADVDAMGRHPNEWLTDNQGPRTSEDWWPDGQSYLYWNACTHTGYDILPMAAINIVEKAKELGQTLAQKELREIRKAQRSDPLKEPWMIAVIDKHMPKKFMTG